MTTRPPNRENEHLRRSIERTSPEINGSNISGDRLNEHLPRSIDQTSSEIDQSNISGDRSINQITCHPSPHQALGLASFCSTKRMAHVLGAPVTVTAQVWHKNASNASKPFRRYLLADRTRIASNHARYKEIEFRIKNRSNSRPSLNQAQEISAIDRILKRKRSSLFLVQEMRQRPVLRSLKCKEFLPSTISSSSVKLQPVRQN